MCAEDIAKLDQTESEPHNKMRKTETNAWDILLGDEEQPIDSMIPGNKNATVTGQRRPWLETAIHSNGGQ